MPPSSSDLIEAVGHPLRRRLLNTFLGGTFPDGFSAEDLAVVHDQPIKRVDYHLKALAKIDVLRPSLGRGADREAEVRYGWAPGVEAVWVRVVLETLYGGSSP